MKKTIKDFFKQENLDEHSVYKVKVKVTEDNVEHFSFLFTGFKTGGYCTLYNNSYTHPIDLKDVYSVEIVEKISGNRKVFAENKDCVITNGKHNYSIKVDGEFITFSGSHNADYLERKYTSMGYEVIRKNEN